MKFFRFTTLLFSLGMTVIFAEKVEITSDAMNAVNMKKQIHFIGNVKIKQGVNHLDANKVIVYFDDNNETKKYEAIGSVVFEFKQESNFYKGHAQKVIYFPNSSKYLLSGNAVIEDKINKRHVAGDSIDFDMLTGNANVKSNSKNKPVKFIFDMESK